MNKKFKLLLTSTILIAILAISCSYAILTPIAKAETETNSGGPQITAASSNGTLTTPIYMPGIGNSTQSANIDPSSTNLKANNITLADSTILSAQPMTWGNRWWIIDQWTTPSYMSGSFTAVADSFQGWSSGDAIIYEPMNVAYGTSSSNFNWFQFCIFFNQNGTVNWGVQDTPLGGSSYTWYPAPMSYTVGHSYSFSFTTSGSSTVVFSLTDTTTNNPQTHSFSSPGVTILVNPIYNSQESYSPASCVEGWNNANQVTNAPTFTTTIGTGESNYYYWTFVSTGAAINGVTTNVVVSGSNYQWSMTPATFISSLYGNPIPIGQGSVTNANYIIGAPNSQDAVIYGGNPGDGGSIGGNLVTSTGGTIVVDGYVSPGYYSDLIIYVSVDGSTWIQAGSILVGSNSGTHIDVCTYSSAFNYIQVTGYDYTDSVNFHLDAVYVT